MSDNRKFGKIVDGSLVYAPRTLTIDGTNYWTNSAQIYLSEGWKRLVYTTMPVQEGYYYTEAWEESSDVITQTWTEHESEGAGMSLADRIADLEIAVCELSEAMMA